MKQCLRLVWLIPLMCQTGLIVGCAKNAGPAPLNESVVRATELDAQKWHIEITDAQEHYSWQTTADRCWAASIQMLHDIRGETNYPSQDELIDSVVGKFEIFPSEYREQAQKDEILRAVALDIEDSFPLHFVVPTMTSPVLSPDEIVYELSLGEPILVGVSGHPAAPFGHVMVVSGIEYERIRDGDLKADQIHSYQLRLNELLAQAAKDEDDGNAWGWITGGVTVAIERLQKKLAPRFQITKVYLLDPYLGFTASQEPGITIAEDGTLLDSDGSAVAIDSVMTMDGREFVEQLDFAVSRASAIQLLAEQAEWLRTHDKGPGIYIQGPPTSPPVTYVTVSSLVE